MPSFRRILDHLRGSALRGISTPKLFVRYRETRDESAIAELVSRLTPRLRDCCRPYLQDADEIDEVVQEVFRLLVEKAETIREPEAVEAWLDETAVNVARNRSRRQGRRSTQQLLPEDPNAVDPMPGPDLLAELREKHAQVLAEIERLNEEWKKALKLKLLDELPYAEVAEILGASLDKVKQDVCRARKELRTRLVRRGIILPAALASVLLGESARGSTPLLRVAVLTAMVGLAVGAIIWAVSKPDRPVLPPPPIPVVIPPAPVAEPAAEDKVLERVVSVMDDLTGFKTHRDIIENGPRWVRWRMSWTPNPDRDPKKRYLFSAWITDQSYSDLTFDRWSGSVGMRISFDGKTDRGIDPLRPIILGWPGLELVYRIPELAQIHEVFSLIRSDEIPETKRKGALQAERVPTVIDREGKPHCGRVEPDQGVFVLLEPNRTLTLERATLAKGQRVTITIWKPGQAEPLHTMKQGAAPWSYRNETGQAQNLFIAGILGEEFRYSCAPRLTVADDGKRILEIDDSYDGNFDDGRVEIVVK